MMAAMGPEPAAGASRPTGMSVPAAGDLPGGRCLRCGAFDPLPRWFDPDHAEEWNRFGWDMHRCTRCGTIQNRRGFA